jgi:hypothetical protein
VLGPWDLKRILSSKPHWCGPQAFGLCSLFLFAMKFFSFVPYPKRKKKNPHWCAGESLAGPLPLSLTGGANGLAIKYLLCFGKGETKQRELGTNHNGWEGSNWEVPGGGAGVVQWSDGTQTTVLLVTASLVRKKEPPLNGARPFSSSLRERETHTHTRKHTCTLTHTFSLSYIVQFTRLEV